MVAESRGARKVRLTRARDAALALMRSGAAPAEANARAARQHGLRVEDVARATGAVAGTPGHARTTGPDDGRRYALHLWLDGNGRREVREI